MFATKTFYLPNFYHEVLFIVFCLELPWIESPSFTTFNTFCAVISETKMFGGGGGKSLIYSGV